MKDFRRRFKSILRGSLFGLFASNNSMFAILATVLTGCVGYLMMVLRFLLVTVSPAGSPFDFSHQTRIKSDNRTGSASTPRCSTTI